MRYLLDTHIIFWALGNEKKLDKEVLKAINDPANEIFFSSASVWEVVIKHSKNPAYMPVSGAEFFEGCLNAGLTPLAIDNQHVLTVAGLHRGNGEPAHNDPFDRLLIAQAKAEGMILITHDSLLAGYGEKCVKVI